MKTHLIAQKLLFLVLTAGMIISFLPVASRAADDIPRMSIQELKNKIDNKEPVAILDVRQSDDYAGSDFMILGAIRIPVDRLKERYKELPADSQIVAYCS